MKILSNKEYIILVIMSKLTKQTKCENCIFFHKGLRIDSPISNEYKAIGECDNIKVPTRICVSYGMICNGKYWFKSE